LWGWSGERGNLLLSGGYRHRSELKTLDRDWAVRPFTENFFGGWSTASNPGQYLTGSAAQLANPTAAGDFGTAGPAAPPAPAVADPARIFLDDGCTELGGVLASPTSCRFQFTQFDNLVNEENHYQLYGEANYDLFDNVEFHGEFFFSRSDVPEERVSPTQSTTQFPTPIIASGASPGGGTSPYPATGLNEQSRFYIPPTNPGLAAFLADHAGAPYFAEASANGVVTSQTLWRPAGYGGNPLYPDGSDRQSRSNDAWRISGGLKGTLDSGINWDVALTYMEDRFHSVTPDVLTSRLQLALRGLGGPGCDPATGAPGVGPCLWYNPFSNGFASNPALGTANPFFDPGLRNDPEVVDWMQDVLIAENTNRLLVFDFVLSGETDTLSLSGGPVGWAIGFQQRYDQDHRERNTLGDIEATPCVDDVIDGSPQCTNGTGPFNFYAGQAESDTDRGVSAIFAELRLPFTDDFEVSAALRQEIYESFGATTNPRISARYELTDWLALRGSVGTTFRAPSQEQLNPNFARTLAQFNLPGGVGSLYRPVDVFGDPGLEPETAISYNAGLLFDVGNFTASVDYFNFAFKDELTTETAANLVSTLFPGAGGNTGNCGNPDFASLEARFTFANGVCGASNLLGVRTNVINGPNVDTSGLDFQASYRFDDVMGAAVTIGGDASYLIEYKRGAVVTREGIAISQPIDRAGKSELLSAFYSYPKWKGNLFVNANFGDQNVRWTTHYHQGPTNIVSGFPDLQQDDNITHDLVYQNEMIEGLTLTAGVTNLTDEDPPFTRSQYNYDYTMASPLGRVFKIGIKKTF
jgi:iron complex outermembrane receptor protein